MGRAVGGRGDVHAPELTAGGRGRLHVAQRIHREDAALGHDRGGRDPVLPAVAGADVGAPDQLRRGREARMRRQMGRVAAALGPAGVDRGRRKRHWPGLVRLPPGKIGRGRVARRGQARLERRADVEPLAGKDEFAPPQAPSRPRSASPETAAVRFTVKTLFKSLPVPLLPSQPAWVSPPRAVIICSARRRRPCVASWSCTRLRSVWMASAGLPASTSR